MTTDASKLIEKIRADALLEAQWAEGDTSLLDSIVWLCSHAEELHDRLRQAAGPRDLTSLQTEVEASRRLLAADSERRAATDRIAEHRQQLVHAAEAALRFARSAAAGKTGPGTARAVADLLERAIEGRGDG